MAKAYALGYTVSGREQYLEQARYWAWTGVPFVYLQPPTSQPVGSYSTIAVLGATNWKAPLWLGRPVQWCGLVYASALHLLSECDPQGPWEDIANGITTVGLNMTWPRTDRERQGLLPDFTEATATSLVYEGVLVPAGFILWTCFTMVLLRGGIAAAIGAIMSHRREFGA